jgi:hypothetical protein
MGIAVPHFGALLHKKIITTLYDTGFGPIRQIIFHFFSISLIQNCHRIPFSGSFTKWQLTAIQSYPKIYGMKICSSPQYHYFGR